MEWPFYLERRHNIKISTHYYSVEWVVHSLLKRAPLSIQSPSQKRFIYFWFGGNPPPSISSLQQKVSEAQEKKFIYSVNFSLGRFVFTLMSWYFIKGDLIRRNYILSEFHVTLKSFVMDWMKLNNIVVYYIYFFLMASHVIKRSHESYILSYYGLKHIVTSKY